MSTKPKSLVWFYVLVVYVLLQFLWWAKMLYDLHSSLALNTSDLHQKHLMVIGEGAVFLFILIVGFLLIRANILKEVQRNLQQRNFLLAVTHELKTPIASVQLALETLQLKKLSLDTNKKVVDQALSDNRRLHKLVDNILLSSQFEESKLSLELSIGDLTEFCKNKVEDLKNYNPTASIEFIAEQPIHFSFDANYFCLILDNLIGNSVKYCDKDIPRISVSLKKEDATVSLIVTDNGPGIEPVEASSVFKKFYRIGDERIRQKQGTGLGLYIVDQIVKLHKGKISMENNSKEGCTFICTFPS